LLPATFDTSWTAAAGPKSPPADVQFTPARLRFQLASSCVNDFVTGNTVMARDASAPALRTVKVSTADWIVDFAGIVFSVSNFTSDRRWSPKLAAARVASRSSPLKLLLAEAPAWIITSETCSGALRVSVVCARALPKDAANAAAESRAVRMTRVNTIDMESSSCACVRTHLQRVEGSAQNRK